MLLTPSATRRPLSCCREGSHIGCFPRPLRPVRGQGDRALLGAELELHASELESRSIMERRFGIWRDSVAIDPGVVGAIQVGHAPLAILLPQDCVPPANATGLATMRRHIDVGMDTTDRVFAPDDELVLWRQADACAIAADQTWATSSY